MLRYCLYASMLGRCSTSPEPPLSCLIGLPRCRPLACRFPSQCRFVHCCCRGPHLVLIVSLLLPLLSSRLYRCAALTASPPFPLPLPASPPSPSIPIRIPPSMFMCTRRRPSGLQAKQYASYSQASLYVSNMPRQCMRVYTVFIGM